MKKRIIIFVLLSLIANWIPFVYLITFFSPSGGGSGIYAGMGDLILLFFLVYGILWTCLSCLYLIFMLPFIQRNPVAKGIAAVLPSVIFSIIALRTITLSDNDFATIFLPVLGVNMIIGIGLAIAIKPKEKRNSNIA